MKIEKQDKKEEYDLWHAGGGFSEESEYYEILGMLLKGKKSVDIGCGFGYIASFSPDTVSVDFSSEALAVARERGVKNLVRAPADDLPFKDDEFEISLSNGVLEHVNDIDKAISEMVRVSRVQILIVHARLPYGLEFIRKPAGKLFGLEDQPIENPQKLIQLKRRIEKYGARVIVEGVWNYVDLRWLHKKIPYALVKWPSHHFLITIKTPNQARKFLGE